MCAKRSPIVAMASALLDISIVADVRHGLAH